MTEVSQIKKVTYGAVLLRFTDSTDLLLSLWTDDPILPTSEPTFEFRISLETAEHITVTCMDTINAVIKDQNRRFLRSLPRRGLSALVNVFAHE